MHSIKNPEQFRENIRSKFNEKLLIFYTLRFQKNKEENQTEVDVETSLDVCKPVEDRKELSERTIEKVSILSTNLEKGIYNYAIKEANSRMIIKKWENTKFTQLYIDRFRTIFLNLKNENLWKK
jgi:hypothetical protein